MKTSTNVLEWDDKNGVVLWSISIRLALLYGLECWPTKKSQVKRLMLSEMRMIRWMHRYKRLDRICNEVIKEKVGVAPIEDKRSITRLRCISHFRRRTKNTLVRRCKTISLSGCRRGRGWPKKSWNKPIRND